MKNIYLFIIALVGLFAVGCNPMADINDEIDEMNDAAYVTDTFIYNRDIAPEAYTLTDEDYELSSNEGVADYKNFSEYALPKDYLPEILNKKFVASDAAAMMVTYNYYSKPVVDEEGAYVLDTAEYAEIGQSYPNFDDEDEAEDLIGKMLDRKVFATEAGAEMTAAYNFFIYKDTRYITVNEDKTTTVLEWEPDSYYELESADYESLGNDAGDDFFSSIGSAEGKMVEFAELKGDALPQTYSCVVKYNNYIYYTVYLYNGANWLAKQSVMAVSEPLNYDLDENDITLSTWWADPAFKVTLGADDYALYPETSKYSNFDLRSGSTPGPSGFKEDGTPEDGRLVLIDMLGGMLDANHNPIDDQQYLVSYAYYDGSNGIGTIRLERKAGIWAEFVEEE